jgi:hypothetical protein
MKNILLLPLSLALSTGLTNAAVVYLEDFNAGTGTRTLADFGLSGVDSSGTSITSSTGFNNGAVYANSSLEGSSYASLSNDWVWMDAPTIASGDLTQVRWLDTAADLDYRLGFEIGGTWYLSGTLTTSSAGGFSMDSTSGGGNPVPNGDPSAVDGPFSGVTVTVFSSGFSAWSGAPATDTSSWDNTFTGTLGTPGALPSGTITRIGLMAEGTTNRPDYFEVTAVPEPSVALLGSLGILALLRRRR